jgi:hypothetical protein
MKRSSRKKVKVNYEEIGAAVIRYIPDRTDAGAGRTPQDWCEYYRTQIR